MAVLAMLAMGLALMASPAEAAPFAYVANSGSNNVSVIDTATTPPKVVATVPVGTDPHAVAVTPDGTRVYVTLFSNVSVIDAATNAVVATVPVEFPVGVAITPDGKFAYVTNFGNPSGTVLAIATATNTVVATVPVAGGSPGAVAITPDGKYAYVAIPGFIENSVSVIATATNTVVATVPVVSAPFGIAVNPDGKHVYVTNQFGTVSVIATANNTVVATVQVGEFPFGVAVTPDGKHAYVANSGNPSTVSVIETATNTVVATVAVGTEPFGVAVTPDGKHAYVANSGSSTVSVIDTATNTVEAATIMVGRGPVAVAIAPPPPGVPFLAFNASLQIGLHRGLRQGGFALESSFTLSSSAPAINPVGEAVTLQVGAFTITIPRGSFKETSGGAFTFVGVIDGGGLQAMIQRMGTLRYAFDAQSSESLTGTMNPVAVRLIIGGDSGATSVTAAISP